MKLEDLHPADAGPLDTGVFRAATDEFIAATSSPMPTDPPAATFPESEAVRQLYDTQSSVHQKLQDLLFLTRPPTFPDDE